MQAVKQFASQEFDRKALLDELQTKANVKVHLAIDLESIVEADGVTMPKPQTATDSMFTGYSIA